MLFHKSLPKKADIYIQTKPSRLLKRYYKPFKPFLLYGIIIFSVGIFSSILFFTPEKQTNNMLASPMTLQENTSNATPSGNPNDSPSSAPISPVPSIPSINPNAPFPSQQTTT